MKEERSKIKSDILLRVRLLYVLFILAGAVVLGRLVWVQLFSSEVAYNAERLASRIFTEETIPAQRGSILSRGGAPLATSIFRYQAAFDFASPGLDSLKTFREQSDSWPNSSRRSSGTSPPPNTAANSARSTPATTGSSTDATRPTCAPKGGSRA